MADRGDTHYLTPTLNKWFLVSSGLLLLTVVWMVIDDWNAPWKKYQREFRHIERERAEAAIGELRSEDFVARIEEIEQRIAASERVAEARAQDIAAAERALLTARSERYIAETAAKTAKAAYDWDRYNIEQERKELDDPAHRQEDLDAALARVNETAAELEQAELRFAQVQAEVDGLLAEVKEAEAAYAAQTRELAQLQTRLESLDPSSVPAKVANVIRDAPGLDFIGPQLKVRKVVLSDLTFELNFTKKPRIDMCMTCHEAADLPGYDDLEQPFASHPRLDLFLTSKSPHPMSEVGCTICHRGSGEALDFIRADHRPSDAEEAAEWQDEYHWHKQHHWDYPMLTSDYVEASCVQCHKDSMELIADEAPRVTEGYRMFERYGCYACHKVEWFPTDRKSGPSLKQMGAKLEGDWVASWISDPKGFRPTTWMPRFFHLENFEPDEVVAVADYGAGAPVTGAQWNRTAVAAITSFLQARAETPELAPIPVEGDAYRGREVFQLSGCAACHNMTPFGAAEPETRNPALTEDEYNVHGPNLRGVATKIASPEWLYHWIKDPQAYWPGTRMPNLRLEDQDAADITAYIMEDPDGYFTDVPEGWSTDDAAAVDPETLREQARWFYSKLGRTELRRRLSGENPEHRWDDQGTLEVAVGESLVMHYGCFSCHEISGLEDMMPIGTELTNWGTKTVDKLDFAFSYQKALAHDLPKLDHHYREGWIERKLQRPRSYDLEKVKNPKEKLRMPQFDFTPEQAEAIATFVVGLVDDEVQRAKMEPTPAQASMDAGLRALRQKNCMGCHVVEHPRITFRDAAGDVHDVAAEPLVMEEQIVPLPMSSLEAFQERLAIYEEDLGEVDELGFRLLDVSPELGVPGDTIFFAPDDLIDVTPSRGGSLVRLVNDYYKGGGVECFDPEAESEDDAYWWATADPDGEGRVQDVDGVFRGFMDEPLDKLRWTYAPPILVGEGEKLQREWFYAFLKDPMQLREQVRVRMPTFSYADGEAEAIADYFAWKAHFDWPVVYARTLRYALGIELSADWPHAERRWPEMQSYRAGGGGLTVEEVAAGAGLDAAIVRNIEAGVAADIEASFDQLKAWGDAQGFRMNGPVDPRYERIERRAPSHLAARHGMLAQGGKIAVQAVNCYQCHFHDGVSPDQAEVPLAWAPDLARTRERLREEWVEDWLWNPALVYPGTPMPANFQGVPPQYQEVFPDSTNAAQLQAVMDWLYNFDRHGRAVSAADR